MEIDSPKITSDKQDISVGQSWISYCGVAFWMLVLIGWAKIWYDNDNIRLLNSPFIFGYTLNRIGVVLWIFLFLADLGQICEIRSRILYTDEDGVWFRSGVLGWETGRRGVRWEDFEKVDIIQGFSSWISGSHQVVIRHRYTASASVIVNNIPNARENSSWINGMRRSRVLAITRGDVS